MDDALAFIKKVYKGKYKDHDSIDRKRVNRYAEAFSEAIEKGWKKGGGKISIDYDSPDTRMLNALRDNVFHFSVAKNRTEIEQLSALLRDEKGRLRKWSDFKEQAEKVTADFQGRYMKVEYDLAVNSSYLAARWQEYDDDDILVYRTAGDSRVRDAHRALDGVTRPKSDPFWNTYYPPNGWNCRCTVVVQHNARITPDEELPPGAIDNVPPVMRTNFAKEGWAFPPKHPYWEQGRGLMRTNDNMTPYEVDKTPNGHKIFESRATHKQSKSASERIRIKREYTQNRITARLMADYYRDDVLLMPEIKKPKEDVRYAWEYLNRGYKLKPKMADSYLQNNKLFYEVKSYTDNYNYNKFSKMMKDVQKQSDIGVLYINQDVPISVLKNNLRTYLETLRKNRKPFAMNEVFVVVNNELHKIY